MDSSRSETATEENSIKSNLVDRILLIGQAPSRGGDPTRPLEGKIGEKIASLAGMEFAQYLARTDRMNVLDRWPGKNGGKGDSFPMIAARCAAAGKSSMLAERVVMFVGKASAAAFGLRTEYLTWSWSAELSCRFFILPHPSGIVRWWNDSTNVQQAAKFLREVFD